MINEITEATGVPAITMMGAMVERLRALGARNLAVGTIYTDEVNEALTAYLAADGFLVRAMQGLQISDPYEASVHDADSSYRLGRAVACPSLSRLARRDPRPRTPVDGGVGPTKQSADSDNDVCDGSTGLAVIQT